ncbi:MAG: 2-hydroxyacid dehydrogenase [Acidobacteria bacterium]|nr:2-hydroxyacid dehydrogenase [Acidobacteriota bacterium]
MLRVGIQAIAAERLQRYLPSVHVVPVPDAPADSIDIDLWVSPFSSKAAPGIFPHLRGVKIIQTLTAGVDSIVKWLPKEITLCDGRGVHDAAASEWVLAAILASLKQLPLYRDRQNAQVWIGQARESDFVDEHPAANGLYRILGEDLARKRVLIVGYGSIGAAIERRLAAFDMEITRVARTAKQQPEVHAIGDLHALLPTVDIVVLIVPLTDETRGLMGEHELRLMKPGTLLVNAARGPVVDTAALLAALQENRIRCAADVTDPEPLPSGHPLWSAPNFLLTPHVASSTPLFLERAFELVARQVAHLENGEALENVVGNAGY